MFSKHTLIRAVLARCFVDPSFRKRRHAHGGRGALGNPLQFPLYMHPEERVPKLVRHVAVVWGSFDSRLRFPPG